MTLYSLGRHISIAITGLDRMHFNYSRDMIVLPMLRILTVLSMYPRRRIRMLIAFAFLGLMPTSPFNATVPRGM